MIGFRHKLILKKTVFYAIIYEIGGVDGAVF